MWTALEEGPIHDIQTLHVSAEVPWGVLQACSDPITCQKSLRNLGKCICVPGLLTAYVENIKWSKKNITTHIYKNTLFFQ